VASEEAREQEERTWERREEEERLRRGRKMGIPFLSLFHFL